MIGNAIVKARADLQKTKSITVEMLKADEIIIGKDVLELISSAMYIDPMTVYREYIQNAADSIDFARASGLLGPETPGTVSIEIDSTTRSVKIRDNGTGIAWDQFARTLTAVGGSQKRGSISRGFRGVGRLAGLGYCQELTFRSRAEGDQKVSELHWDCRKLKSLLRAASAETSISELIQSIVTLQRVETDEFPLRFFEVEMKGMVRLRSDRLMSPEGIADYLSEVAPVPFSPEFALGAKIVGALADKIQLGNLAISVSGVNGPIYRPHRDLLQIEGQPDLVFDDLEIFELPSIDGESAAIGWVLHHQYDGALSVNTLVRGLRLRSGNIQVGDHAVLEELFAEVRFNVWSVGEIHVVDKNLLPNGRRDHFEQNGHFNNLINQLAPLARDISKRCRTSSIHRKQLRDFELQRGAAGEAISIIAQATVSETERERLLVSAEQSIVQLSKLGATEGVAARVDTNAVISSLAADLAEAAGARQNRRSPLERFSTDERKTYEDIFGLIYECSANRVVAKLLIDRILQCLDTRQ
jgi:molecular chaperone HtpG